MRLTRAAQRLLPQDGEVAGLPALMLLTDARRGARTAADGRLVPLEAQDRTRWDRAAIAEGVEVRTSALRSTPLGPYRVQAAIVAVRDEAPSAAETDWPGVLALYDVLERLAPSPVVTLNRAVAVAMVHGPAAGLEVVGPLADDAGLAAARDANARAAPCDERGLSASSHLSRRRRGLTGRWPRRAARAGCPRARRAGCSR